MEKRTSTDIRTWIQNGDEVIAASVRKCKKRHNTDRTVTTRTRTDNQPQMSHFFTSRTHSHNVKRWLQENDFSFYITICNTYKTVYSHIKFLNLDFNQRRPQSIYHQDQSTQPLHHISTIPDYSNFFLLLYLSPTYKLIVIH